MEKMWTLHGTVSLRSYWKQVFKVISELTSSQLPPSIELAILHINIHTIPSTTTTVVHILRSTKLNIMRKKERLWVVLHKWLNIY